MVEKKEEIKEIQISTIKTPKGEVPTLEGLETVVNELATKLKPEKGDNEKIIMLLSTLVKSFGELSLQIKEIGVSLTEITKYVRNLECASGRND